jgi:hypothetical protein
MWRTTRLQTVADLNQYIAYYESKSYIDVCLIGTLTDLTELQLTKFAKDGRLFGYWTTFDPPTNPAFQMISKHDLHKRTQILSEFNQNQIIFMQAHECSEKLLYQKSPFRKIDK